MKLIDSTHSTRLHLGSLPDQDPLCLLSRHDHHNIELQTFYDQPQNNLKFYLFMPKSLQLLAVSKDEVIQDFRTYTRLSVSTSNQKGVGFVKDLLNQIRSLSRSELQSPDELSQKIRMLGSGLSETLKNLTHQHQKILLLSHSLSNQNVERSVLFRPSYQAIEEVSGLIDEVRSIATDQPFRKTPAFDYLDEYLSHLYIEYLSAMRSELDKIKNFQTQAQAELYAEFWERFHDLLDHLQSKELMHIQKMKLQNRILPTDQIESEAGEKYLARISQLKKFFQSSLFCEVSQREAVQKFNEPAAALGAVIAAAWTTVIEHWSSPKHLQLGFSGLYVICLGVLLYALKDRMKDFFRKRLTSKIKKFLPDIEKRLFANETQIGQAYESFRLLKSQLVPHLIQSYRTKASLTDLENTLPEDVLFYEKRETLQIQKPQAMQTPCGVRQIIRINLQRYLRFMDDPFKEISVLKENGKIIKTMSHKVYYLYAIIHHHPTLNPKIYRIIMDKNGVNRVELSH